MKLKKLARPFFLFLFLALFALPTPLELVTFAELKTEPAAGVRFAVSFPASSSGEALDGRVLLLISKDGSKEPRFQINEDLSTQQVFGIDVEGLKPGQEAIVDASAFGYPIRSLSALKPGDYFIQALLHRYETFKRSDGHTVKLPMDRGEGQQWNRAPGNLYSTPQKLTFRANDDQTIKISSIRLFRRSTRLKTRSTSST